MKIIKTREFWHLDHAFLNRTTMSLKEAEEILKLKSGGYLGMGYMEVKE